MDLAGGAIGETALAGPVLLAAGGGGGTAYDEGLSEAIASGDGLLSRLVFVAAVFESFGVADAVATQAVMGSSLAEGMALGDVPSAPGGTISDFLSGTTILADAYAASGLWTVVVESTGDWSGASPAAATWTMVPAPPALWLKH